MPKESVEIRDDMTMKFGLLNAYECPAVQLFTLKMVRFL